ncbi:MAG: hypothetical protein JWL93_169 [Hyphomicrobiales bacterium]|nr:hypothetical protein [Hyphomicrobiales bacterium]
MRAFGQGRTAAVRGAILTSSALLIFSTVSAARAQYEDIRPGDRIVYVQPGTLAPMQGEVNVRRLRRVEDDRNLVYEYDRPGEPRARQRIVIDPRSVVQDIERVKKPKKAKRKETKTLAARPEGRDVNPVPNAASGVDGALSRPTISPEKSSPDAMPVAASDERPAVVPGETRPRENKNVRVIPLYKPAQAND